jgi:hypothetical protein
MPLVEMKMTYYWSPLNKPSCGQPWCCGPLHHRLSPGSSYWTDLFIAIPNNRIEKGGWRTKGQTAGGPKRW